MGQDSASPRRRNMLLEPTVLQLFRKQSCCGCSAVVPPCTPLQPQQLYFRKPYKTSCNILSLFDRNLGNLIKTNEKLTFWLGCSWLLLAAPGCSWLLLAASGCFWLLLAAPGCSRLLLVAPCCSWLLLAVSGCSWPAPGCSWLPRTASGSLLCRMEAYRRQHLVNFGKKHRTNSL